MLLRQFCLDNKLQMHIKENTDFPQQKPQQLPNAEVNFEGCCNAGTALWFKLFNVFLHFKHDIDLFTKINFLFVSYLLCLYGPYGHFQQTFFCWKCLVKGYELSDNWVNWFNVVICSLSFNHLYCLSYVGILCLSL